MLRELSNFIKFAETRELPSGTSYDDLLSQISAIEIDLRHKLLKKIDGMCFVTDFGKDFLPYAKKCISAFNEGLNVANEFNAYDQDNYLTVGISRDSASTWAMNCIQNFNRLHPGLRLSIIADDNLTEEMTDKATIIFWCFENDLENYNRMWYVEYKYGLYASDNYIKKYGIPTLANIQEHKIIAYSGSARTDIANWHLQGDYGLPKLKPTFFSQSRDLMAKMTADGVGIGPIADRQDVYYGYKHLNRVLKIVNGPSLKNYFFVRKDLSNQMLCNVDLLSGLFRNYFITRGVEVFMTNYFVQQ